jgi:hypothetical protein
MLAVTHIAFLPEQCFVCANSSELNKGSEDEKERIRYAIATRSATWHVAY